jgi:hypothetical protein
MNAWFMANLKLVLLVIAVALYAMIGFEIWRGRVTLSNSKNTSAWTVYRESHPRAFWIILAVQFAIITGLLLVFYFLV